MMNVSYSAQAQRNLINFELRAVLKTASQEQIIDLSARGELTVIEGLVKEWGGMVTHRHRDVLGFRIQAGAVEKLAQHPAVSYLEFSEQRGRPLNDSMLVNNRFVAVHEGVAATSSTLLGNGVVIGLVDTGIELQHPDFQNPDGSTRVKFLWDQTQNTGEAPQPYSYGSHWTAQDIDDGVSGHQDQPQYFGHGSTVSGTAASNGLAVNDFGGAAPHADLVVVSSQFSGGNWTQRVADAVQYVFEKADELGKPAVVNLSLGTYSGSRDGLDAAALFIDSLMNAQPGRVVVCAAGNSGNWPAYHLGYDVTQDTAFTWFQYNANSGLGYGAVFFEAWADTADFEDVQFAIGADRVTPSLQFRGQTAFRQVSEILNTVVTDTLKNGDNVLAVVEYFAALRGGQYQVQYHMATPDSSQYRFRLITKGSGRFDVWSSSILGTSNMLASGLPDQATFPDIVNYRAPDKQKHIVGSWACSPQVITVANYNNRDQYIDYNGNLQTFAAPQGQLSINSSHGPTRDNRIKPEIAASGDITLSTANLSTLAVMINNEPFKVAQGGMHYRNGGTSMASPVVSGAAALLLEMCPYADWSTIRQALLENVYIDSFSGLEPNNAYGYGKLDAAASVQSLFYAPTLNQPLDVTLCEGEILSLSTDGEFTSYNWTNGSEMPLLEISEAGQYAVTVVNDLGCLGKSDTVSVEIVPVPEVEIWLGFDTLFAAPDTQLTYQWLLEGVPVEGATDYFLNPSQSGNYSVEVQNAFGCNAVSNDIAFIITSLGDMPVGNNWKVFPIPVSGVLTIEGNLTINRISMWSSKGQLLRVDESPKVSGNLLHWDMNELPGGQYVILIEGDGRREALKVIKQ